MSPADARRPDVIVTPAVNASGNGRSLHLRSTLSIWASVPTRAALRSPRPSGHREPSRSRSPSPASDPNIPDGGEHAAYNYFGISPNAIRYFKYMSIPQGGGNAAADRVCCQYDSDRREEYVDMIIKYAGPACESGRSDDE
ncbi:MAG: hypothetical protein MZV70_39305 [Desulfobacterales bacterium]|nr:hypothetical protein [Desulfobacterales bacterium]